MSSIELTPSQRSILGALVNLHSETESSVKGETIAQEVDRNPGTIRNQMQSLKALQLVEGVPGPKGGYKPTAAAYEVLEIQQVDEPAQVTITVERESLADVNVVGINLTNVHHPDLCRAEIGVHGSLRDVHLGDAVSVGPTPVSDLQIDGVVEGKDETENLLILRIEEMRAPATE